MAAKSNLVVSASASPGPSTNVKFEGPEEVRMADWLEGALKRYATTLISRKSGYKIEYDDEEVRNFPMHITSLRYSSQMNDDPSQWEQEVHGHTISEIEITYSLSHGTEEPQYFLSKASRVFCNEEKGADLDAKSSSRVQEINLYTKVVPGLEDWALRNGYLIQLPLPHCYFGNYECTKIDRVDQRTKNYLTSIGIKYKGFEEDQKNIHPNGYNSTYDPTEGFVYEMNSIIVLEQLTKTGYENGLPFQLDVKQVETASKKIAEYHALSYAWASLHKRHIKDKWPIFPKSKAFIKYCSEAIEQAFPVFLKLMQNYSRDKFSSATIDRLEILKNRIPKAIFTFLRPVDYPMPNGIIHLDLWPTNIFFLKESSASKGQKCFAAAVDSQVPPESEIQTVTNSPEVNMNQSSASADCADEPQNKTGIKDCRFIGWNLCNFGPVLHDLAFLLFTSLAPDLRRASTIGILKSYFGRFKTVCNKLNLEVPFDCQMLYDAFPSSLLFATLMALRSFNENSTAVDASYLNNFAEVFIELLQLNYI